MKLKKFKFGDTLKKSNVIFKEEEHEYWLGDKQLSGITGLISKHIYGGNKYENVPEWIIERARQVGSLVHSEIENYYKNNESGFTVELYNFIEQEKDLKFKVLENEFTVSDNENFATNIDLILELKGLALCDIKTTAQLDTEYLSWQLSINAEMFEMQTGFKVDSLMAYWTREDRFVEITRKSKEEIDKLFECERQGGIYNVINENTQAIEFAGKDKFIQLQGQIQAHKVHLKELQAQEQQMKAEIMKQMKLNGIKSYDMGEIKLTYIAPSKKKTVDSKLLKTEQPEIYKSYLKESSVKEQLKITYRSKK